MKSIGIAGRDPREIRKELQACDLAFRQFLDLRSTNRRQWPLTLRPLADKLWTYPKAAGQLSLRADKFDSA